MTDTKADDVKKVVANELPLPLTRPIADRPPSDRLPFTLNRKLGELGVTVTPIISPKPPQAPIVRLIAGCVDMVHTDGVGVGLCHDSHHSGQNIAHAVGILHTDGVAVWSCVRPRVAPFIPLWACYLGRGVSGATLSTCVFVPVSTSKALFGKVYLPTTPTVHYQGCAVVFGARVAHLSAKTTPKVQASEHFNTCQSQHFNSKHQSNCGHHKITPAVSVPCRYYPIPEPPKPPAVSACQIRPPSDRLPFRLTRKSHRHQGLTADALPFNLVCWHDTPATATANLRSYIVHNTITATLGGLVIEPLSFSIKTDMDSFCWQGSVELTAKDYAKIRHKLDVARGNEPVITVAINGIPFAIIAEEQSKSRQFANHTHTLSGRSITARLSKDYAGVVSEMMTDSLYASQIIANSLANLPYTCEILTADWLIPSGTYPTSSKTPIAIMGEIAAACGGFVASDKADGKLTIRPRYKVPAWELTTANPDQIIALDVIRQISQQKQTNPRYNTVVLTSQTQGAIVYREREGRDKEAPSVDNALYTDQACIIPSGIAILSDSGTHESVSITTRWADKYNLPLANLGEIWQVNDKLDDKSDNAWRGIVTSIAIDVKVDNGVPSVWQTVELDRYLDE